MSNGYYNRMCLLPSAFAVQWTFVDGSGYFNGAFERNKEKGGWGGLNQGRDNEAMPSLVECSLGIC